MCASVVVVVAAVVVAVGSNYRKNNVYLARSPEFELSSQLGWRLSLEMDVPPSWW